MQSTANQEQPSETNIFTNDELNEIIGILQTSSHKRTPEELETLQNYLNRLDFFADFWANLEPETSLTLLKQLKHEYAPRTKTIFNYGDPPNRFYLVLSGSVFAIAPKPSRKKTMTTTTKPAENNPDSSPSRLRRVSVIRLDSDSQKHLYLQEESAPVTNKELSELHPGNFLLCVKKQGEQFGEVALNFGTTRTATMVSREHTHLITLQPSTYTQILSKYKAQTQKERVEFFQAAPVTSKWPFESIIAMTYLSKMVQYQKNQHIYDIGDPCNYIYFVKEGEVEIFKEAHLDMLDDDASNKKMQARLHLNLDKAKLSHVNAIWKQQYSKLKVQQVAIALLGKYQIFGTEEIGDGVEHRLAKAVVKSSTAEIYVVSYQKFLEGTSNAHDLCKTLLNADNNTPKNEWRENLAQQAIGARLTTENNHKSKFNPDFIANSIVMRNNTNEDSTEPILEKENKNVSSLRRFTLINDHDSPAARRRRSTLVNDPRLWSLEGLVEMSPPDSIESLQVLKKKPIVSDSVESPISSNRKKSQSPDRIVEVPVVTPSILPLRGAKKKKFVNLIHPESTEVKLVFNEKKKIAIDPSLVSVCLDLSPASFQGSKVYQKRRLTTLQDSVLTPKSFDTSSTPIPKPRKLTFQESVLTPKALDTSSSTPKPKPRMLSFLPMKTDTSDISSDKSPFVQNIQEYTPVNVVARSKARPFEKKLGELLNKKNPKLNRAPQENFYCTMAINSMFVSETLRNDSGEIKKKEFYSPRVASTRKDVQLPSIGNCYQPGMAMTRSLPQKKALGSYRNQ